ncbi:MAG: Hsp20/alpha crystallin family protein [Chloroflexi bacterium]|nr:Hsp20/alpha crystallin family protein [Chloroflexota bacterium]
MATESKELQTQEVEKQEITTNGAERTRARKVYVPRADIFETNDAIVVVADMPGVDDSSVDITLEKNVLSINGFVEPTQPDNYSLAYTEYEIGDYFRRFTLSDEVDQDNIEATVKNGVLRLHLPKAGPAQTRKIAVKAA